MEEKEGKKKTVAEIMIEQFLKDVDEKESMPWQRPYERYNSINYITGRTYRGINRLILPFGEYLTKKQIMDYNKANNEDFRFQKGIIWYPVVFFTVVENTCSREEIIDIFGAVPTVIDEVIGRNGAWLYYINKEGTFLKRRNVLKYYSVADRKYFKNSKGETLPSNFEDGDLELVLEEPSKVYQNYIKREGLSVDEDYHGTPCYIPALDKVCLNPHTTESSWYSIAFHELAHSTGAKKRLNRKGINYPRGLSSSERDNIYAVEECIAEITASLLCGECGIHDLETSGTFEYDNNIAYVQSWKKRIQDWGSEFIYIVSQADKAFNFILGDTEDINR